jgi:hypothetical protein
MEMTLGTDGGLGDLLRGVGGRRCVLSAANSTVDPVVRVFGLISEPEKSVVIENLVIDGQNMVDGSGSGVTGILLQNVPHCLIRNVTIRNCEVGIHIRSYKGLWSECNTLKHIRMENVKKGIVFTTTGPYKGWQNDPNTQYPGASAAFTTIEDVDIGLKDIVGAIGIQLGGVQIASVDDSEGIGDSLTTTLKPSDESVQIPGTNPVEYKTNLNPYSSHIRATVRVGSNGVGFKVINGLLHYAQAHLTVIGTQNGNGVGVDLQEVYNDNTKDTINYPDGDNPDRVVWHNQFSKFSGQKHGDTADEKGFVLVTSNISSLNRIKPSAAKTDIRTIAL